MRPRKPFLLFCLLSFIICVQLQLPSQIWAQNYIISKVEIAGNKVADGSLVSNISGLAPNMSLDPALVQEAIKQVYALGLFSDVQIWGTEDSLVDNGVKVTIQVKEYPKLSRIELEGSRKIKTADIKEKIALTEGKITSPVEVKETANKIESLYREKGYILATVTTEAFQSAAGDMILKFKIKENQKIKIKAITFQGNRTLEAGKLRGEMKNKPDNWLRSGEFDREKYLEDKERIVELYKKNGYLDAIITKDSIWYDPSGKYMYIRIWVSEGDQYRFGEVSFEGNKLYSTDKLKKQLKFSVGEIYDQKKLEQSIENIQALYLEEGYLYLRADENPKTTGQKVNLNFSISEGVVAHVRKINIEGNYKTKEKVIRRELSIKPGQVFKRSYLMRSLRDVTILNYFASVVPAYDILENGDIDLTIKVEEKPTGQINFGAGYSVRDKLVGNIGLVIPNLFGNGQEASLNWEFGKQRNTLQLSFTEPWFRDTPTSVGFDIYQINRRWYSDFTEEKRGGGLRLGKRLSWPDNYFRIFWRYRLERIRYYDFSATALASYLQSQGWPKTTSSTDVTIIRDTRDQAQFATRGSTVSWNTELAGGILGGSWSYHKHILEASRYTPVFWKFTLLTRVKAGVIDGFDGEQDVPYIERFSPGGVDPDGIIRGYPDGLVGPVDANGAFLRGRSELIYNIELQFPIIAQQIYGTFLFDAGNAWLAGRDVQPLSWKGLKKGAGFGVQMIVPGIGLIGLHYAYGFDYEGKTKWRPHFIFGSAGF